MQCRKGSSTLRVGPKGKKQPPKIIFQEGKQDEQIKEYLEIRDMIKQSF